MKSKQLLNPIAIIEFFSVVILVSNQMLAFRCVLYRRVQA